LAAIAIGFNQKRLALVEHNRDHWAKYCKANQMNMEAPNELEDGQDMGKKRSNNRYTVTLNGCS